MINPTAYQLAEFYDCSLHTGYETPQQAITIEAREQGSSTKNFYSHKCEYCPGYHAYDKSYNLNDGDKAQTAWQQFITLVFV